MPVMVATPRPPASWPAPALGLSPAAEHTYVSAIHARSLVEAAETLGVPSSELLLGAQLDDGVLQNPYSRVQLAALERLTARAVELSRQPAFGLHWGERSPMLAFDVISLVFGHAPSLRAGLDVLLRCQALLGEHPELALEESATRARFVFRPMSRVELVARVRSELAMTGLVRLLRLLGGSGKDEPMGAEFAHARPLHHADYVRIFGDPCRFGRRETALELPRRVLDRPLPTANPELHRVLVAQAELVLRRVREGSSFAEQLRTHVRALFPHLPTMEAAARSMGMSPRSLRRRLAEEGISFSRIVQEAQRALAELLLVDAGLTIQQVASETGFTNTTAFHRAFRRWTGHSPQEFRDRLAQDR